MTLHRPGFGKVPICISISFSFTDSLLSSHAMGPNQLCTFSWGLRSLARCICAGLTVFAVGLRGLGGLYESSGGGVWGDWVKVAMGRTPWWWGMLVRSQKMRRGCWTNTPGMGQVLLSVLSSIKAVTELKRLVLPPPEWVLGWQPFHSPPVLPNLKVANFS